MMVEILSGPLVGASYCDYETFDKDWGFFIFAIDPELLVSADEFKTGTQDIANLIRKNGSILPGDNGRVHEETVRAAGELTVEVPVVELLQLETI